MTELVYKKSPNGSPDPETIRSASQEFLESIARAVRLGVLTAEQEQKIRDRSLANDSQPASAYLKIMAPYTSSLSFDELSAPLIRLHNLDYLNDLVDQERITTNTAQLIVGICGLESIHLELAQVNRLKADIEEVDNLISSAKLAGFDQDPCVIEYSKLKFEQQFEKLDDFRKHLKSLGILSGA